jgi:hypothetical protein
LSKSSPAIASLTIYIISFSIGTFLSLKNVDFFKYWRHMFPE